MGLLKKAVVELAQFALRQSALGVIVVIPTDRTCHRQAILFVLNLGSPYNQRLRFGSQGWQGSGRQGGQ